MRGGGVLGGARRGMRSDEVRGCKEVRGDARVCERDRQCEVF